MWSVLVWVCRCGWSGCGCGGAGAPNQDFVSVMAGLEAPGVENIINSQGPFLTSKEAAQGQKIKKKEKRACYSLLL